MAVSAGPFKFNTCLCRLAGYHSIDVQKQMGDIVAMVSAVLFLFGCFLAAIASLGRLWCSLYIAGIKQKNW